MNNLTSLCFVYWLFVLNLALITRSLKLTILHNNDFHTHFEPINDWISECKSDDQCFGGIARSVAKANELRSDSKENVLFLNAGDHFQGTIWYTFMKWEVVAKFVKLLRHDVMALGNHEFDNGVQGLIPFIKNVSENNEKNLPIIASNIETSGELKDLVKPSIVVEREGRKIALIGYITPDTAFLASPGNTVKFNDEIDCIRKEIKSLKQKYGNDLNIFIAVGHSGFEKDKQIAKEIPELDIVVGGHSNTFLYTGKKPSSEEPEGTYPVVYEHGADGQTLVVQAFAFGKYLGKLDVVFDDNGVITHFSGNPILLDHNVIPDPNVSAEVQIIADEINEHFKEQIGFSNVLLDYRLCRESECNLGNLIVDSYVDYLTDWYQKINKNQTSAPLLGLINGGSIRSSISAGNITMKEVVSADPFSNYIGILMTNGSTLWNIMQHSASQYKMGGFMQVSGLRYQYNSMKPIGERLEKVSISCGNCSKGYKDLELNKTYALVITDYLVNGGDNYTMMDKTDFTSNGLLASDILSAYIRKYSPIDTQIEDRIIDSKPKSDSNGRAIGSYLANSFVIFAFCLFQLVVYLKN